MFESKRLGIKIFYADEPTHVNSRIEWTTDAVFGRCLIQIVWSRVRSGVKLPEDFHLRSWRNLESKRLGIKIFYADEPTHVNSRIKWTTDAVFGRCLIQIVWE